MGRKGVERAQIFYPPFEAVASKALAGRKEEAGRVATDAPARPYLQNF
jgi:hypothetical protein